jgi:hypothetical protein
MSVTLTHVSNDLKRAKEVVSTLSDDATLTAADCGKVYILDAAEGKTVTLPALEAGLNFKFMVGAAFATTNWVIDSAEGDNITGNLIVNGAAVPAAAEDQINFVATAETVGDYIELICDSGNSQWIVMGVGNAAGSITATDPS